MRAGIVAIFFFAGLLALGHYVAAPFFCRGGIAIPTLDARALCGADLHFNRQGSVLLYFASIVGAMFFGLIAALLPGGRSAAKEKSDAKPVETFEEVVNSTEKKAAPAPVVATPAVSAPASAAKTPPPVVIGAPHPSALGVSAAAESKNAKAEPEKKSEPVKKEEDPLTASIGEAITAGLAAKKSGATKNFDGTNEELLERFRELKKQEGVNAIAQAQRLLDESTLSALSKGIDPKQHLSQVAHLVLAEDPDLKSGVVRGVVVHVAARLKELGVVNQTLPTKPAKSA